MRNTWIKCLLFLCTLCTIYFTHSPSTPLHSIEYYSSYTDENDSYNTTKYSHWFDQIDTIFGSIEDDKMTFVKRATYLRSLQVSSMPKMYNIAVRNNRIWSCVMNVVSYLQFYNIKAIVTDETLLMLLLINTKTSTIDSSDVKGKNVINFAVVKRQDDTTLSNDLLQLCYNNSVNNVTSNSSDITILCDSVKDTNNYQSDHVYIDGLCGNFSIQLTTLYSYGSDDYYSVEPVDENNTPNYITKQSSNYGTLESRQLLSAFKVEQIDINVPIIDEVSDDTVLEIVSGKINIPDDAVNYLLDLYSSKWITCYNGSENTFTQSSQYPRNNTTDDATKLSIVYLTKLLRPLHIPFWLMSGTLLGWYRECRAIPFTTDADFAAFSTTISSDAVDTIFSLTRGHKLNHLKLFYRFGKLEKGFELSFKLPRSDWKIDLFFMYPTDNSSVISTVGHAAWKSEYYEYFYPSIDSLCSTVLLDQKVNVPCNVVQLITTEYGYDWYVPKQNYSYVDSPTNRGPVIKWIEQTDGKQVSVYG